MNELLGRFLKENADQTTLDAYPKAKTAFSQLFDKAALATAKSELERVLDIIERNQDKKQLFQPDLLKALRLVEPIYVKTRDPELRSLLQKAEGYFT